MRRAEQQIQIAVFEHLRRRGVPGVFVFHVPMGGFRRPVEAAILKTMGSVAGIPDLVAIKQGRVYALELKAEGGKLTPAQITTHEAMRQAGATVAVAEGLDAAVDCLERWELVRGTTSPVFTGRMQRAAR